MNAAAAIGPGAAVLPRETSRLLPEPEWGLAGTRPTEYELSIHFDGSGQVISLESDRADPDGFGSAYGEMSAAGLEGKLLRLTALVRTDEVSSSSNLWLRSDGPEGYTANTSRRFAGTNGWTRVEVVIRVAPEAKEIHFGSALSGPGRIDMKNARLEVLD
jgi:hypothetical protein